MKIQVQELRNEIERKKGQRDQLEQTLKELEGKIHSDMETLSQHEQSLEIVKQVALITQRQLEYHLSEQVSLAMEAVFDDPYRLKLNFQEKRGKTEVETLFTRRELEFPPMGSAGGGTIDVASLALQIAYMSMRKDKKIRPLLLLDEPFSRLKGEDANRRALAILREISRKLSLQIIMISDERVSREDITSNADKLFEVSQGRDGVSKIRNS
jgi:DNA repair exonuclease SbcCD ATPase subunit